MNQKGFTPILILVGTLLLSGVIVGGAYIYKTKIAPNSSNLTPSTQNPVKITPTPISEKSDETTDWKTDTKLGYEIKYPPSSVITEYSLDPALPDLLSSTSTEVKVEGRQASVLFLVSVWKNLGVNITDTSSRDKWCSLLQNELTGQLECFHGGKLPLVQVNGYNAYQTTGGRDFTLIKTIYIPHDGYVYELTIPIEDDNEKKFTISDQILSTFKFLNQNSQSYTCPQNGWENCMPILSEEAKKACSQEAIDWYKANCPNFQGVAQ